MSLEITGKLLKKYDAVDVSPKFKKREFVLELSEEISGNIYTNYAAMQLVNNKCSAIDQFQEGDMVKVNFNIRGTKWVKDGKERYFSNLDAWRVEKFDGNTAGSGQQYAQPSQNNYNQGAQNGFSGGGANQFSNNPSTEATDDLPF